jgi:hypothetical protein
VETPDLVPMRWPCGPLEIESEERRGLLTSGRRECLELLHPAHHDCDTFVCLTKLKDHVAAGITLSMKNCFGNIPTTVYGDHVPEDAPLEVPTSGRGAVFHNGARQPPSLAAPEIDPGSPRDQGYRIPRVVVDIGSARPIDIALIDGIETMGGSEGPWGGGEGCRPGVLVAGTNCVNADEVRGSREE